VILGVGLDLVEIARIARLWERHGRGFADRICAPGELQSRPEAGMPAHLAGLFAAKEAVLKALGTGWAEGLGFAQVEVTRQPGGAPGVRLHGAAAARAARLGVDRIHLSITHERGHAAAVAILEGTPGG
jgi:holo-[acyl-carrier protein] synthase